MRVIYLKLCYEPKWEIEDKRVEKLDKKRVKLNRYYSLIELELFQNPNVCPSLETISQRRALIKSMETSMGRIEASPTKLKGFDELVFEDIKETVKKARADDSYFHNPHRNLTLGQLLTALFGRSAYTRILSMARSENLDHKALHDYYNVLHDMWTSAVDSSVILNGESFKDLRKKLIEHVKKYRASVDTFYRSLKILSQSIDYKVEVDHSGADFSCWDNCNKLMVLDPDRIPSFKTKEGYTTHTSTGLVITIHEFGHGLQHAISKICMPEGLHYDDITFSRISHGTVCEGTALFAEDLGLQWMRANRGKINLEENELRIAEISRAAYVSDKIIEVAHGLLEMENSNSNAPAHWKMEVHKKLAEITGLKVVLKDNNRFGEPSFDDILLHLSYIMGERRIRKTADRVRKEIGYKNSHGKGLLLQSLMTGAWTSPKCQERFILEHLIPRARHDDYL